MAEITIDWGGVINHQVNMITIILKLNMDYI